MYTPAFRGVLLLLSLEASSLRGVPLESSVGKLKALLSLKTSGDFYPTTQPNIPEQLDYHLILIQDAKFELVLATYMRLPLQKDT